MTYTYKVTNSCLSVEPTVTKPLILASLSNLYSVINSCPVSIPYSEKATDSCLPTAIMSVNLTKSTGWEVILISADETQVMMQEGTRRSTTRKGLLLLVPLLVPASPRLTSPHRDTGCCYLCWHSLPPSLPPYLLTYLPPPYTLHWLFHPLPVSFLRGLHTNQNLMDSLKNYNGCNGHSKYHLFFFKQTQKKVIFLNIVNLFLWLNIK